VQYLASQVTFPFVHPAEPVELVALDTYHLLVGKTYRMNYKHWTRYMSADHKMIVEGAPLLTGDFGSYWEFTPTTAGSWSFTIRIMDRAYNLIRTYVVPVMVYAATARPNLRHLAIGDSITDMYEFVSKAVEPFGGVTVVTGTRPGGVNVEVKTGWSLAAYHTHFGRTDGGDSLFLFPTDVAGEKYLGNTEFWKQVCYTNPNGLGIKGYQKIARGWSDTAPFLFDANGYPTNPTEGDVVFGADRPTGSQWLRWTSGAWLVRTTPTREFSFAKYFARFAAAFVAPGLPTSVQIMLGTNDFGSLADVAGTWNGWKAQMDTTIASLRAWNANVPLIIIAPPNSGGYATYALWDGSKVMRDKNAQEAVKRIFDEYDTDAQRANKVHVISMMGAVSEANITDTVHPNTAGHIQMAAWTSGKLAHLISLGVIA
jgi:lysophospholipase L1-like esterase